MSRGVVVPGRHARWYVTPSSHKIAVRRGIINSGSVNVVGHRRFNYDVIDIQVKTSFSVSYLMSSSFKLTGLK